MANNMLQSLLFSGGGSGGGSGGDGGVLVVRGHESGRDIVLDKTWKEICDAPAAVLKTEAGNGDSIDYLWFFASVASEADGEYNVIFGDGVFTFTTESEDGYPAMENK